MSPAQCRAARALFEMTQAELAGKAVVPVALVADYEAGTIAPRVTDVAAMQSALERMGIDFIGDVGVKLKPSK